MANSNTWRKLRVVVELPVRGKLASEKRLHDVVYLALSNQSELIKHRMDKEKIGVLRVMEYNRFRSAESKKHPAGAKFARMRELIAELSERVSQLEAATNP